MRVETVGDGKPAAAVIGGIHGDEPCGVRAIERFFTERPAVDNAVKCIIANEEALAEDVRFLDTDLNRCFPGDPDSELHEERLAAQLLDEIGDLPVLAMHSTRSTNTPFGFISDFSDENQELAQAAGVSYIIDTSQLGEGALEFFSDSITVECGLQGSETAAAQAYEIMLRFLRAYDVLPGDVEPVEQEYFRAVSEVPKEPGTEFTAENFVEVAAGEVYAKGPDGRDIIAEEPFYPILMSTDGYEDILGLTAEKVEVEA